MASKLTPLERLRRSGIAPDRGLGQNFLIDANILDVIERMASLASEDVVLEVGPGLGILTERLLDRCGTVHCIELDRRLAAGLEREFGGRENFRFHQADAVRFDFTGLDPAPTKFVANLPYNVAAPLIMISFEKMPAVTSWCLMLQKEIADRLFAFPGASNYGGISVMTQLLAEKDEARLVPPTVFYPRPRVLSSLLAFHRREPGGFAQANFERVKQVVYASFSHRRKKLVNCLAEAPAGLLPQAFAGAATVERKRLIVDLFDEAGLDGGARPQELTPGQFETLVRSLDRYGEDHHA